MSNVQHRRRSDRGSATRVRVAFAGFELGPDRTELRQDGAPVAIGATALRLLSTLVAHAGDFVPKEALVREVWPDVAVSDASVYTTLRELRQALGDDGKRQRLVETKRGAGYRLTVSVHPLDARRLEPDEIAERWRSSSASEPKPALIERIALRTGGLEPLVDALITRLCAEGVSGLEAAFRADFVELPFELLERVVAELPVLPPGPRTVLQRSAIFGTEFDPDRVAALGAGTPREVSLALDAAVRAGWLESTPASAKRMRFPDTAVSEYLRASHLPSEREALHAAAARALEAGSDELDRVLEVASHWLRSGASAQRAIPWCRRAADGSGKGPGREASVILRFAALAVAGGASWQERYDLLCELGDALHAVGEREAARTVHHRAVGLARVHGDAKRLATAVLAYSGSAVNLETTIYSERRVALLEEALTCGSALGAGLLARLRARLAQELGWAGRHRESRPLIADALVRVRGADVDPAQAFEVFHDAYWATWSPDNIDERIRLGSEMHASAERAGDPVLAALAGAYHGAALLESGDRVAAEAAFSVGADIDDEEHGVTLLRSGRLACVALMEGRFREAEQLAATARENGLERGSRNVDNIHAAQMAWLRFDQGRLRELEPVVDRVLGSPRAESRAGRALILANAGRESEARSELQDLVAALPRIPRDPFWIATHATLIEVAAALRAEAEAKPLYEALRPYSDRSVLFGIRTVCRGSVEFFLGLAARSSGFKDLAVGHFERAVAANARLRAAPLVARSLTELAETLDEAEGDEPAERARLARAEAARIREHLRTEGSTPS